MAVVIGLDGPQTLRLAAEGLAAVHIRVVVDLHERLERDAEPLAVTEHPPMVVRQAPRTGIDVMTRIEAALLGVSAQFRVSVATSKRPVAAAGPPVVLEYLNAVAGGAQFVGSGKSCDPGPKHEDRCAFRCRTQLNRLREVGFGRKAETV